MLSEALNLVYSNNVDVGVRCPQTSSEHDDIYLDRFEEEPRIVPFCILTL